MDVPHGVVALGLLQVVMRPQAGLEVKVELYDKDIDKDDFLGR